MLPLLQERLATRKRHGKTLSLLLFDHFFPPLKTTICTLGPKCIMFNYVLAVKPSSSKYCHIIEECRKQSWIYSTPCLQNRRGVKKIKVVMDILQNAFSYSVSKEEE